MKILITSGGTKVHIDRVRDISNMAGGGFASKIARALISQGALKDVYNANAMTFFHARGSITPFSVKFDPYKDGTSFAQNATKLEQAFSAWNDAKLTYQQLEYVTYDDYKDKMIELLRLPWDLVIAQAAVSDYVVANYFDGKVRSGDKMKIDLVESQKILPMIKKLCPTCHLVGFKLLVDSTDQELVGAANKILIDAECDFVVANDLRDIQSEQHRVLLVDRKGFTEFKQPPDDPDYLPRIIAQAAIANVRIDTPRA